MGINCKCDGCKSSIGDNESTFCSCCFGELEKERDKLSDENVSLKIKLEELKDQLRELKESCRSF